MKKKVNILITMIFVFLFSNICYAKINNYVINDEYKFQIINNSNKSFIEIFLGNINGTTYQEGVITISPKPTSYKFDDFNNRIAVYDLTGYQQEEFTVKIKKNVTVQKYNLPQKDYNMEYDVDNIYLKPSQKIESDNPLIISKANEITYNIQGDYNKAKAIFEYVNLNLTYDTSSQFRNKGALSALKTKRGVCEEYATLFVAFCRASNIPARAITGFMAEGMEVGDEVLSNSIYHAWAEVYLQGYGWIPMELTAEKMVNGVKVVFNEGLFKLPGEHYIVEGMHNDEVKEIIWYNAKFINYNKYITYISSVYFNDIQNHWAKQNIEESYDRKIINGYEDGSFKPDNNISRIEFIAILSRFLKQKNLAYVNTNSIYYTQDFEINWAKEDYDRLMRYYGYFVDGNINSVGYTTINHVFGDSIKMNKNITREEVVALMYPFFEKTNNIGVRFNDVYESKFKKEIETLSNCKIINGYEDNSFRPTNSITRAEVATMFSKIK